MRVCQVMECTIGGTRRHIRDLCGGLAERGARVTLVASAERDPTFRRDLARLSERGVEVIELPMVRPVSPRRDLAHARRLTRLLRERRFDLLHTHSSKAGALGRFASLRAGRPARRVHTPHTFAFRFDASFSAPKRRLFLEVERFLGRRTDRFVHVSASEARVAAKLGVVPAGRGVVIENGIDPSGYRLPPGADARAALGVGPGRLLVGTVGLLNAAKGHLDFVEAAALAARQRPDLFFCILGEGELRGAIEASIERHGLSDRFSLPGYHEDVARYLCAFDVFCLPSLWEGMPYALLEAMAAARPAIATDVDGSRDLLEEGRTGLLVPRRDPQALAAAIVRLAGDAALRASLGREARRRVEERHSLDRMVAEHVALYEDLLAGAGKRAEGT